MRRIVTTRHLHVGVLDPWSESRAFQQKLGLYFRVRGHDQWRQAMIFAGWPHRELREREGSGRSFALEAKSWRSTRVTGRGSGVAGSKVYVRLKVGMGGYNINQERRNARSRAKKGAA